MSDGTRGGLGESRSVAECLDDLHHNIEGMLKVPRMPRALRLMLTAARSQIDQLQAAVERELPSAPPEVPFAEHDQPR